MSCNNLHEITLKIKRGVLPNKKLTVMATRKFQITFGRLLKHCTPGNMIDKLPFCKYGHTIPNIKCNTAVLWFGSSYRAWLCFVTFDPGKKETDVCNVQTLVFWVWSKLFIFFIVKNVDTMWNKLSAVCPVEREFIEICRAKGFTAKCCSLSSQLLF